VRKGVLLVEGFERSFIWRILPEKVKTRNQFAFLFRNICCFLTGQQVFHLVVEDACGALGHETVKEIHWQYGQNLRSLISSIFTPGDVLGD